MARSHGKILCRIWQDDDFRALHQADQWAFMMLLSQPRVSLVGAIDYYPGRWALYADDTTERDVEGSLDDLQATRFVIIDVATRELLIRSFTRWDGIPISNPKLRKGLWGAWEAVASPILRQAAVDNMPDEFFEFARPAEADRLRRSTQTESPPDYPIESSTLLPPTSYHHPPSSNGRPSGRPATPAEPNRPQPPSVDQLLANQPEPDFALGLDSVRDIQKQLHHHEDHAE